MTAAIRWRGSSHHAFEGSASGDTIAGGVSSSFIVLVLVLAAGIVITVGRRPPWTLQPATLRSRNGRVRRPAADRLASFAVSYDEERPNPLLDSLRAAGILRQKAVRPVVGPRAYVRWWERVRAALVLTAIIAGLGIALAAVIGVTVVGAGFLLEQAIS